MAKQLQLYATEGLRTLVLASKDLTEEEWKEWDAIHKVPPPLNPEHSHDTATVQGYLANENPP